MWVDWSQFVFSDDADAGLDEDEIVRVAHMYRVVAGDSVSRSYAQSPYFFWAVFASIAILMYFCSIAARFSIDTSQVLELNADVRDSAECYLCPVLTRVILQIASPSTRLVVGQSLCVVASSSCDSKA